MQSYFHLQGTASSMLPCGLCRDHCPHRITAELVIEAPAGTRHSTEVNPYPAANSPTGQQHQQHNPTPTPRARHRLLRVRHRHGSPIHQFYIVNHLSFAALVCSCSHGDVQACASTAGRRHSQNLTDMHFVCRNATYSCPLVCKTRACSSSVPVADIACSAT